MANGNGPGDLYDLAAELRDVCEDALDTIPLYPSTADLLGAPDRVYVSEGAPVLDCCDQLAVHVQGISEQFVNPQNQAAGKVNMVLLVVTQARCIPVGETKGSKFIPPTVEAIQAAARQGDADGWALWNRIYNEIRAETFLSRCRRIQFLGMTKFAEGECGGWQLTFNAELGGYEEVGT